MNPTPALRRGWREAETRRVTFLSGVTRREGERDREREKEHEYGFTNEELDQLLSAK